MTTRGGTERSGAGKATVPIAATARPVGAPLTPVPNLRVTAQDAPRSRWGMARRRLWAWLGGAVIAIAVGATLYLHPWVASKTVVAVETVTPGPLKRVLALNGTVAALNSVSVRSPVAGTLVALEADVGDRVAARDVLARVDTTLQQAVVQTALAALEAGKIAQAQARAVFSRTEALGANVSRNALEDAARAVQSADQDVVRLDALVQQARIELRKYTIAAPIAGTVLTRGVDPGQQVDTVGTLFTLADTSQLIVETNVDETYATQIATGQPAVLQFVGETQTRTGRVIFVAPQVDVATGGLEVKIAFDTPQAVPVGLTVAANIIVDQQSNAISVPRAAILRDPGGAAVFLVRDGAARRQAVTVTDWPADRLEVASGLRAGDVLILDPSRVKEGQPVTVRGR